MPHPVPAPRPAAWVRMPPGASDFGGHPSITPAPSVDLTREMWWLHQLWCARLEWKWCLGVLRWPKTMNVWNPGAEDQTIISVTVNDDRSVTIECTPGATNWIGIGRNPWVPNNIADATGEGAPVWIPDGPTAYDAVIEVGPDEDLDPDEFSKRAVCDLARVVQVHVLSRDSASSFTVDKAIHDYVTSGQLSSLDELVGRFPMMIRAGGWWHTSRWPAWANAEEVERSTVAAFTANSVTFALPRGTGWTVDKYVPTDDQSWELHVSDADGLQRRIPIKVPASFADPEDEPETPVASDAEGRVYFDTQDDDGWAGLTDSVCVVVRAGERYRLGHEKHQPWRWYAGARDLWWSVGWTGALYRTMLPAGGVEWNEEDPLTGACVPTNHPNAMDNDMVSGNEGHICGPWEQHYSPHVYKTLRQLQVDQEADAGTAIEPKSYSGADGVPWMTVPILFRKAGVNAATSTVDSYNATTGAATIVALDELPFMPIRVYFTVHVYNDDGDIAGEALNSSLIVSTTSDMAVNLGIGLDPDKVEGATVDITFGRTRFAPRHFLHMWPRSRWIADIDPETGDAHDSRSVINWEESGKLGVGKIIKRGPSTTYTGESGKADGAEAFVNGELARWTADGWNIPIDGPNAGASELDPQLPYFARFYSGRHPTPDQRAKVEAPASGQTGRPDTVHANRRLPQAMCESRYRFCVPGKNLYETVPMGGSYGHVESGTASGGSDTSFEDNSKVVGEESGAFIDPDGQWDSWGDPYVGYVIEFELPTDMEVLDPITGEPTGETEELPHWHARPLKTTSTAGDKFSGTWDEPFHMSVDGKPWRIREPSYTVQRWEGRRVTLAHPDATRDGGEILTNDDHWVYLATPLPADEPVLLGTEYAVRDYQAGGVWKRANVPPEDGRPYVRQGSEMYWVAPRGDDVERTGIPGTPGPFHVDQSENEPTYVRRFGRIEKDDLIRHRKLYEEFVAIENVFRWTKGTMSWSSRADPDVPEDNYAFTEHVTSDTSAFTLDEAKDSYDSNWDALKVVQEFSGAPYAYKTTAGSGDVWDLFAERRAAYAIPDPTPAILAHTTAVIVRAGPLAEDEDTTPPSTFVFDAQGDNVVQGKWSQIAEGTAGPDFAPVLVGTLPPSLPPNWPDRIIAPTIGDPDSATAGWETIGQLVIHKFDVPGGRLMLTT